MRIKLAVTYRVNIHREVPIAIRSRIFSYRRSMPVSPWTRFYARARALV